MMEKECGWKTSVIPRMGIADLEQVRDGILAECLEGDVTDLVFVDQDIVWLPVEMLRLCLWNVDVVGGLPRGRSDPEVYPCQWDHLTAHAMQTVNPMTGEPAVPGLLKMNAIPTGLLRLSRTCMRRMSFYYEDLHYFDHHHNRKQWNLFKYHVRDHERWSEDITFCERWRDLDRGSNFIWCDPFMTLGHIGYKKFEGNLDKWLRTSSPERGEAPKPRAPAELPPPVPVPLFGEERAA
jgi:hypothetical protein